MLCHQHLLYCLICLRYSVCPALALLLNPCSLSIYWPRQCKTHLQTERYCYSVSAFCIAFCATSSASYSFLFILERPCRSAVLVKFCAPISDSIFVLYLCDQRRYIVRYALPVFITIHRCLPPALTTADISRLLIRLSNIAAREVLSAL